MNLRLVREEFSLFATGGSLFIDGEWVCFTLEDCDRYLELGREKIYGKTAIPRGTYTVVVDHSTRFDRDMPHVLDVPGFRGIRIHSGNGPDDTEGCILVGRVRRTDAVYDSRLAFSGLLARLAAVPDGERITLEIV